MRQERAIRRALFDTWQRTTKRNAYLRSVMDEVLRISRASLLKRGLRCGCLGGGARFPGLARSVCIPCMASPSHVYVYGKLKPLYSLSKTTVRTACIP